MILFESTTNIDKIIGFASNGVLSIRHKNFETSFAKINKQQACELARVIMKWSAEQPDE